MRPLSCSLKGVRTCSHNRITAACKMEHLKAKIRGAKAYTAKKVNSSEFHLYSLYHEWVGLASEIMTVRFGLQDSQDPNPLIRALAVRTMGCIRVDKITEYLCDPLQRCLKVAAHPSLNNNLQLQSAHGMPVSCHYIILLCQ